MKLSEAIELYVERKYAHGILFRKGAAVLSSFLRDIGDVTLDTITAVTVTRNLIDHHVSINARRAKHGLLKHFFDFCSFHEVMPVLRLGPPPAAVRSDFMPYVYTAGEVRTLMRTTPLSQRRNDCRIDAETLRLLLLTLFATGAFLGEVLDLRLTDISLKKSRMVIRGNRCVLARSIPICFELWMELRTFIGLRLQKQPSDCHIFRTKAGRALDAGQVNRHFRRLRRVAGIARHDGAAFQPRIHDFRHTFAVHRITSWIKTGENLNRMLPALAVYMGNAGLESTQRYLAYTPERFRKELQKLSPQCSQRKWCDNRDLMSFLSTL